MLTAISDIHFVDGTAGEYNLPFSAFKRGLPLTLVNQSVSRCCKTNFNPYRK